MSYEHIRYEVTDRIATVEGGYPLINPHACRSLVFCLGSRSRWQRQNTSASAPILTSDGS